VDIGIVGRNEQRLYRAALAIMKGRADAEDIVQDVFVKYMEKQPQFESYTHEAAWLMRVTINCCRSRLRSSWWKMRVPLLDIYPARDEGQRDVVSAVLSLPVKYRMVIHLFYYEGYTTREISEITVQKESTVRQQLTRARRMLGEELGGELAQ